MDSVAVYGDIGVTEDCVRVELHGVWLGGRAALFSSSATPGCTTSWFDRFKRRRGYHVHADAGSRVEAWRDAGDGFAGFGRSRGWHAAQFSSRLAAGCRRAAKWV